MTQIVDAERSLGIPIEGAYRSFLMQFGWGGVEHLELYGLGKDAPAYLELVAMTQSERTEMNPRLRPALLPVMNDGAGNLYCLDTSVRGEPPVVFWDHTQGTDQVPELEAADFASWLSGELDSLA